MKAYHPKWEETETKTGGTSMADRFGLTLWEPFRGLERAFDRGLGWLDWPTWERPASAMKESGYFAPLEVFDRDGHTVVRMEVPGVEMGDIDIIVSDGILTIRGEKKKESEVKEGDYYHCETSYGAFHRQLAIPKGVDAEKIEATYEHGVLELLLPKAGEAKVHKIEPKSQAKSEARVEAEAKPKRRAKAKAKK